MKLNPVRKKVSEGSEIETRDATKQRLMRVRLKRVSETVRHKELATVKANATSGPLPAVREAETISRPTIRVKLTRPHNLTLNSEPTLLKAGTETVWKGREMTGRHLPVLQCNACSISRVCPKFKAGYECAYLPYLHSHRVESGDDLIKYMKLMVGNSMKRAQLMSIIETANGGMPSVETSEALDMAFNQLKELHNVMEEKGEDSIEIEGDATIVGSIFKGMKLERMVQDTIEMKANDPVPLLTEVPLAEGDVRGPAPADVSDELIRDAILNAGKSQSKNKGLPIAGMPDISQGEIQKML